MTRPSRHTLIPGVRSPRKRGVLAIARRISLEHPDRTHLDDLRRGIITARARRGYDTTVEQRMETELRHRLVTARARAATEAA